jgi:hypothetical protein
MPKAIKNSSQPGFVINDEDLKLLKSTLAKNEHSVYEVSRELLIGLVLELERSRDELVAVKAENCP